jgi:hypothetical protein
MEEPIAWLRGASFTEGQFDRPQGGSEKDCQYQLFICCRKQDSNL